LRRSKAKGYIPILLFLLLLSPAPSSAQEARVEASLRGQRVYGSVEYVGSHSQEVLASLWDGLKAEITFQVRLYRQNRGFFAFIGDRLLVERRVSQIAYFDFFENRYKIQRDGEPLGEYAAEVEFLDSFFSLASVELGEIEPSDAQNHYLLGRVRMMPVKIIEPLNIIILFSSGTAFTTPWIEAKLRAGVEEQ
jgi:hypothetical protein